MKRLLTAVAVALVLTAPARAADKVEKVLVLAAGINKYDAKSGLSDIPGPVNDATGFVDRFRATASALGVPDNAVWTQALLDEKATRRAIRDGLLDFMQRGGPNTLAVVLLSGHGSRAGGRWEFCPHDYRPGGDGGISGIDVLSAASRLASSGATVVVVIDACEAGEIRASAMAESVLGDFRHEGRGGVALFLSSIGSQSSLGGVENSKFAGAMLEALSGAADRNGDAAVTMKEAVRYMTWRVRDMVREGNRWPGLKQPEQDFVVDYSLSLSDSLVLARTGRGGFPSPFVSARGEAARPDKVDLHAPGASGFRSSSTRPWLPDPLPAESGRVDGLSGPRDLTGTWRVGGYTLAFGKVGADGWGRYRAEVRDAAGDIVEVGSGRYEFRQKHFGDNRFAFSGPHFAHALILESKNDEYALAVFAGADANELKVATDATEYFVWAMAKKMIAKPELRRDYGPAGKPNPALELIEIHARNAIRPAARTPFQYLYDRARGYVVVEPRVLTLKRAK